MRIWRKAEFKFGSNEAKFLLKISYYKKISEKNASLSTYSMCCKYKLNLKCVVLKKCCSKRLNAEMLQKLEPEVLQKDESVERRSVAKG
jgi:hypothetical protein